MHLIKDRGLNEVALLESPLGRGCASRDQSSTFVFGNADALKNPVELLFVGRRSHLRGQIKGVAQSNALRPLRQALHHAIRDRTLH